MASKSYAYKAYMYAYAYLFSKNLIQERAGRAVAGEGGHHAAHLHGGAAGD